MDLVPEGRHIQENKGKTTYQKQSQFNDRVTRLESTE